MGSNALAVEDKLSSREAHDFESGHSIPSTKRQLLLPNVSNISANRQPFPALTQDTGPGATQRQHRKRIDDGIDPRESPPTYSQSEYETSLKLRKARYKTLLERVKPLSVYARWNGQLAGSEQREQIQQDHKHSATNDVGVYEQEPSYGGSGGADPLDEQLQEVASPVEGTCKWIFDRDEYKRWRDPDGSPGALVILAPPGQGKTVLVKSVCLRLKKELGKRRVLAFFCKSKNSERESAFTIIASFLYRLLMDNEYFVSEKCNYNTKLVVKALEPYLKEDQPSTYDVLNFDKIWELFLDLSSQEFASGYIFLVDALDECNSASQRDFRVALRRSKVTLRSQFLITARPELEPVALATYFSTTTINANASTFSADAETFVLSGLQERGLDDIISEELVQLIGKKVREDADGMFLIFSCRLDELKSRIYEDDFATTAEHLQSLMDLPFPPVLEFFAQMLNSMATSSRADLGIAILNILLVSQQPLTRAELTAAKCFSQKNFPSHEHYLNERPRDIFLEAKKLCGSIVRTSGDFKVDTSTMDIVHNKARELLDHDASSALLKSEIASQLSSKQGHVMMAIACLKYLLLPELRGLSRPYPRKYPFMLYALLHWPLHVAKSGERVSEYKVLLGSFLAATQGGYSIWASFWPRFRTNKPQRTGPQPISITIVEHSLINVLYILADGGLPGCPIDLNEQHILGGTALNYAIHSEHVQLADQLLEQGADPNLADINGITPLHMAARLGYETLIRKLVAKGAAMDAEGSPAVLNDTPLWAGVRSPIPSTRIFQLLYDLGARKMVRSDDGWSILHEAARNSHLEFVKYLLDHGYAGINDKTRGGVTALIAAAGATNGLDTVQYLATHPDLEMDHVTSGGATAFSEALSCRRPEIAAFLLPRTQNVHTIFNGIEKLEGATALHVCAIEGYLDLAKALVQRQINIDATTEAGWTALALALLIGESDMARFLIQEKADVNHKNSFDESPLLLASRCNDFDIVEALLEAGADSTANNNGVSPLHMAAWYKHARIAEHIIMSRKAEDGVSEMSDFSAKDDVGVIRNYPGFTPLHCAVLHGSYTITRLLLASGADICAAGGFGRLPIHEASLHTKNKDLFELILDKTPATHLSASTGNGETPLSVAAGQGFECAVSRLLEKGADVSITTEGLRTPLMWGAMSGSSKTVELILEQDSSLADKRDENGWTALHFACQSCHDYGIVDKLMKATKWQCRKRSARTPVELAVESQNKLAVKAVLANDMPVDLRSDDGWSQSALEEAIQLNDIEIVELLLQHGARLDALTSQNIVPYAWALRNPEDDVIKALSSDSVELLDRKHYLSLESSIHFGARYVDTVKMMAEKGLIVTSRDVRGLTTLHHASIYRNSSAIDYLLDQPHLVSLVDSKQDITGQTALIKAAWSRSPECVRLLLQKGHANPSIVDYFGRSVYDYAHVHQDTLRVLAEFDPESYDAWFWKSRTSEDNQQDIKRRIGHLLTWLQSFSKDYPFRSTIQFDVIETISWLLLYAGDFENGRTADEIIYGEPASTLLGWVFCVICLKTKRTSGFLCSRCVGVHFCTECKENKQKMSIFGCDNHELFAIPRESWFTRNRTHVNDKGQTEETWLEELYEKYNENTTTPIISDVALGDGITIDTRVDAIDLEIFWDYPQDRRNVFDVCSHRSWDELKAHLSWYPHDIVLLDETGDNMTMWALRHTSEDANCLEILELLSAEAGQMLFQNPQNETSIEIACKRGFGRCLTFLLKHYDMEEFNRTEDRFSSDAMTMILANKWHDALKFALEHHFDWASQGSFEFLKKLDALGFTDEDIIAFLESNPDIYMESPQSKQDDVVLVEFQQLSTGHRPGVNKHHPGCVHEVFGTGSSSESSIQQQQPDSVRSPAGSQNTHDSTEELSNFHEHRYTERSVSPSSTGSSVTDRVAHLCGFAGVFPNDGGSVSVKNKSGVAVAHVSYASDSSARQDRQILLQTLLNASRGLLEAMSATQEAGICCDTFTVLCDVNGAEGINRIPLVKMCRIPFELVLHLVDDFERIATSIVEEAGSSFLSPSALAAMFEIRDICSFSQPSSSPDTRNQLDECCEMMQFLCLAFLTFLGAQSSHVQLPIHGTDFPPVIICGSGANGTIAARPRKMACIGRMLQEDLVVFRDLSNPQDEFSMDRSEECSVLANVQDVLEIWGPGNYIYREDATSELIAVALRHGFLSLNPKNESGGHPTSSANKPNDDDRFTIDRAPAESRGFSHPPQNESGGPPKPENASQPEHVLKFGEPPKLEDRPKFDDLRKSEDLPGPEGPSTPEETPKSQPPWKYAHWFPAVTKKGDQEWMLPTSNGEVISGQDFLSGSLKSPKGLLSFHPNESLIIGGLKKNEGCPISTNESHRQATYKQAVQEQKLCELDTAPWSWQLKDVQLNGQLGQYALLSGTIGLDRRPCRTRKMRICRDWARSQAKMDHNQEQWSEADFHTLSRPYGMVFSVCSSFAKRVPLREAVAEGWLTYTSNWENWPTLRQSLRRYLKGETPSDRPEGTQFDPDAQLKTYIRGLPQTEQAFVHRILLEILETLQHTGVVGDEFKIAWPQVQELQAAYYFRCSKVREEWVRLLQDTDRIATFAIMTNDCLIEDRGENVRHCRNHSTTSSTLYALSLLDTIVIPHKGSSSASWQLSETCYLITEGPRTSRSLSTTTKVACKVQSIKGGGSDLIVLGYGDVWARILVAISRGDHGIREADRPDFDGSKPVTVTPFENWRAGRLDLS